MIMKSIKKIKKNYEIEKISMFSVKRMETGNLFGACFLMQRISRNRHLLESSNNTLKFSPY